MDPASLGSENDCAYEDQPQLKTTEPSSRLRERYIRTITASVQLEKNIIGHESRGACREDELIFGKPPVVK
jgi:hypothetical protein